MGIAFREHDQWVVETERTDMRKGDAEKDKTKNQRAVSFSAKFAQPN